MGSQLNVLYNLKSFALTLIGGILSIAGCLRYLAITETRGRHFQIVDLEEERFLHHIEAFTEDSEEEEETISGIGMASEGRYTMLITHITSSILIYDTLAGEKIKEILGM